MPFVPKDWKDSPDTTTPLTAAAVEDQEVRVTDYADLIVAAIASDAAAATPSKRTLGATATSATAGNDPRVPTQAENDALIGTSGTPGSANKFVTHTDPRLGGRLTKTADYTIVNTDPPILAVTNTAAARTITLPAASGWTVGVLLTVKDESGGAATNNITVVRAGTDLIEGSTSKVISVPYGFLRLYSTGSAWMVA